MTAADMLSAARRRWYVVVIGALLVVVGVVLCQRAPAVWWTQVDVVFLGPSSELHPNSLGTSSQSLISTAGVVQLRVQAGRPGAAMSGSSVSLVGEGIRDGASVRLPNAGGQWADNFDRPVLDVQVVGPSRDEVEARAADLVAQIAATLEELQTAAGADAEHRIVVESAPRVPVVSAVTPQPRRAAVAVVALGGILTAVAVAATDAALLARTRRRVAARAADAATGSATDAATGSATDGPDPDRSGAAAASVRTLRLWEA